MMPGRITVAYLGQRTVDRQTAGSQHSKKHFITMEIELSSSSEAYPCLIGELLLYDLCF